MSELVQKASLASPVIKNLSVLTWNIWFENVEIIKRYDCILDYVTQMQPDVVCLQEVIPTFLDRLKLRRNLLNYYAFSDPLNGETMEGYGVMTMVKKELNPKFTFHGFPTRMGRKLLLTSLPNELTGSSFCIGNVHLESLDSHSVREAQLKICAHELSAYENYVLVGDYNFCSYRNYSGEGPLQNDSLGKILPTVVDLWPSLHPSDEKGYTFHGQVNPMVHNPNEVMRYDRICAHLNDEHWKANSIQIVGDEAISEQDQGMINRIGQFCGSPPPKAKVLKTLKGRNVVEVFPFDHFGLFAQFSSN